MSYSNDDSMNVIDHLGIRNYPVVFSRQRHYAQQHPADIFIPWCAFNNPALCNAIPNWRQNRI